MNARNARQFAKKVLVNEERHVYDSTPEWLLQLASWFSNRISWNYLTEGHIESHKFHLAVNISGASDSVFWLPLSIACQRRTHRVLQFNVAVNISTTCRLYIYKTQDLHAAKQNMMSLSSWRRRLSFGPPQNRCMNAASPRRSTDVRITDWQTTTIALAMPRLDKKEL